MLWQREGVRFSLCHYLSCIVVRHGKRMGNFNERYFDQIESEAKAYWLGFIFADGCVLWNERTGNYAL